MEFMPPYPYLCFLLLLFFLSNTFSTNAQTYKNVSLGSSLTEGNNNDFWLSQSGEFAFGFREIGENSGFLLAIWFDRIPEKTIIWSANGDNLVESGSKVELTTDGELGLKNSSGGSIWQANSVSSNGSVSYAAMLDSGNFVLATSDSKSLWESFGEPTDTILPTQSLAPGSMLIARYNEKNYSKGRFILTFQDGSLFLSTKFSNLDSADTRYWKSNTSNAVQLIFNQSGSLYLAATMGSILTAIPPTNDQDNIPSTNDFYHRAILEYDGVFRHYFYPKSTNSSGNWSSSPNVVPPNICVDIFEDVGGGACGINSFCRYDQEEKRPSCSCPVGYSFRDPNSPQQGCKGDFISQSCDEEFQEKESLDLHEMKNSDFPGDDYEELRPVTEDVCREACLADCLCVAVVYVYARSDCFKKTYPLSNGRTDPSVSYKTFLKIRKGNSTFKREGGDSINKDHSRPALLVLVIGSVLLGSSVLLFFFIFWFVYRNNHSHRKIKMVEHQLAGVNLRCFTYEELRKATDGFMEKLGRGAAGTVFKGFLTQSSNEGEEQHCVAVKRLENMVTEDESEFKAEVSSIGSTRHRNIVRLLGFCNEGQHRLLVYEYMKNGSLANFLFGDLKLDWTQRREIALGTARGLLYLHEECSSLIIHCDIKPQNILVDDSFTARIADFGLAKLLKIDRSQTTTAIRGTKGYVAPEWFRNKPITAKVDVYSYGVLLLELICSRKSFDVEAEDQIQMVLSDWVYDCFVDKKVHLLLENDEEAMEDIERVEKHVMTAIWCIQEDPSLRPTMKMVIQMLEGTLQVSPPPDPCP